MFRLGKSVQAADGVERPLTDRVRSAGYASMAYWFYRWDWGEAVAMDGLLDVGHRLHDTGMTSFVTREVRRWVRSWEPGKTPNPMGPAVATLQLSGAGALDADSDRALEMLASLARVTVESGRSIGGVAPEADGRLVFVDSFYGLPEFLARYADATDAPGLVEAACELVAGHCDKLQRADGLFAHFADPDDPGSPQIPWGRGNGWAALGLSRFLQALGPERTPEQLTERFVGFLDVLRETQSADGYWRNLVDDPHSYLEASTTVMVAAGVAGAVAAGVVPASHLPIADLAWAAVADRIDANGHLLGVSYRPGVNTDRSRYEHTPMCGAYPWGQGPYLLAAAPRLSEGTANHRG